MSNEGIVYLVGAGPGDPSLITVKGRWCVEQADLVVYDRLVSEYLLSFCRPEAELIYVGKETDRHTMPQHRINQLLVDEARQGKVVCRLKGGDPFVFGRGGEEAELLAKEGVPFEIVPGITAAVAVPAYAGIPVTHRDYASFLTIATGHQRKEEEGHSYNYAVAGKAGDSTAVYLMGFENLSAIRDDLLAAGWDPATPAALVRWGTRAEQMTVGATLADIQEKAAKAGITSPAVLVVGGVVNLRKRLAWRERSPLFGRRILITRPLPQAHSLARRIIELGGEPVCLPTIAVVPPKDISLLDQALNRLEEYDWFIFTSANGVNFFLTRLRQLGKDLRSLRGKLTALGPATAAALRRCCLTVAYQPDEFRAEALLEGLLSRIPAGSKVLLARAEEAREVLPFGLRQAGIKVEVVPAYRTIPCGEREKSYVKELLREHRIDYLTLTSSSTAKNLTKLFAGEDLRRLLEGCRITCIGPVTAATATSLGLKPDLVAGQYTGEGLLQAMIKDANGKTD